MIKKLSKTSKLVSKTFSVFYAAPWHEMAVDLKPNYAWGADKYTRVQQPIFSMALVVRFELFQISVRASCNALFTALN
jgi:hypothetical protein